MGHPVNHRIENKRKSSLRNLSMIGNYWIKFLYEVHIMNEASAWTTGGTNKALNNITLRGLYIFFLSELKHH